MANKIVKKSHSEMFLSWSLKTLKFTKFAVDTLIRYLLWVSWKRTVFIALLVGVYFKSTFESSLLMTKITRKAETSKCAQLGPDLALFSGVGKRRAKVFIENNTTLNSFWETSKVNNKKDSIWENENENSPFILYLLAKHCHF